jgi:S-adenosylmethionine:tRNA ribosyltransferase-isomerase
MKTSDFDYELPAELIAQEPLADRAASRMMVVHRATGEIAHDQFRNLGRYLRPGDLLVLNDTKVIPARVWAEKPAVELLLIEDLGGNRWSALVKPGKRAKIGMTLQFAGMTAVVEGATEFGGRVLRFSGNVPEFLDRQGMAPLPPYIKSKIPSSTRYQGRAAELARYQTVFARHAGAVAAPTAGLHFTPEMLARFPHAFITLHVGIGTFRPVQVEEVERHKMHAERFEIPAETRAAIAKADRVIAVGTTVVRALESPTSGTTDIFIRPPFEFKVVDALLTNFHLPKSTLLMLVSAFASRELILRAYAAAVRERYRFFSYGDCMLIL